MQIWQLFIVLRHPFTISIKCVNFVYLVFFTLNTKEPLVNKTDLLALFLGGTYCHKTGIRPPSSTSPWEPTIYISDKFDVQMIIVCPIIQFVCILETFSDPFKWEFFFKLSICVVVEFLTWKHSWKLSKITVTIWILDKSGIQMVQTCLVVKWSGFLMVVWKLDDK